MDEGNTSINATAQKLDTVAQSGMTLANDIIRMEEEFRKSIEEEKHLVVELSKDIPDLDEIQRTTIQLIANKERIKDTMEHILARMEQQCSDLRDIDTNVELLRGQVAATKGLIAKLIWQSEQHVDPRTNKYIPMSMEEYRRKRKVGVVSSQPAVVPLEYKQYLMDSLTRDELFERNLVESMREGVEKLGQRYVRLFHKIQGLAR